MYREGAMKLEAKVAILTAAGRGIGRGIALCLAEEGANVVVNSYREETTQAVADEIKAMGRSVLPVPGDITQPGKIMQVVEETISTFGKIDILVNNVGGVSMKAAEAYNGPLAEAEALWDGTCELTLKAPILMCAAVTPHFIAQKSGKMVNISSMGGNPGLPLGKLGGPALVFYNSLKAGLIRYTQLLADMLGPSNINVNCVCPGIVYTDAWKGMSSNVVQAFPEYSGLEPRQWFDALMEGRYPEMGPLIPLRREQTVEDIARAVVFLVSDDAVNITGQSLGVDGGIVKS